MTVQTISIIVALLAMSALFSIVPRLTRPDLFFGVTVSSDFRRGSDALGILRRFHTILWVCTLLAIAVEIVPGWPLAALLIQGAGFTWALVDAHARAMRFAAPTNPIVEVDLAAPHERLPGGMLAALLPFLALVALGIWASFNMDRLPPRFPVHYGLHGPDRWVNTTPATVFASVGIFAAVCLLLTGIAWALLHWSRRISTAGLGAIGERSFRRRVVLLLIVIEYLMVFPAWAMLFQVGGAAMNIWGIALLVVITVFVASLIHAGQGGSRRATSAGAVPIGDRTPDACWKWGVFYVNRADPAVFIEKRFGIGYTVNLGNRWTWIAMLLFLVPIMVCAIVLR